MPETIIDQVTEATVNSPADLMDLQEKLEALSKPWAFRGQPGIYGTLIPYFQRVFNDRQSIPAAMLIERKLIEAFRMHYKDLKDLSPDMPSPDKIDEGRDMKCLSVMQHYGVPTRLLDWTAHFWTAVYFACIGKPNEDAELWYYDREIFSNQNDWLVGLDPHILTPGPLGLDPKILSLRNHYLIFEFDPRITPRMERQSAFHTVCTDVFTDHASLLFGLNDKETKKDPKEIKFSRIIISKGCKEKTIKFLDENYKINASSVFPDVEGLGRFLRGQLDSLLTTIL